MKGTFYVTQDQFGRMAYEDRPIWDEEEEAWSPQGTGAYWRVDDGSFLNYYLQEVFEELEEDPRRLAVINFNLKPKVTLYDYDV